MLGFSSAQAAVSCTNTITANVVVLDNPTVFNRLGAQNPNWITYALERDVVVANRLNPDDPANGTPCSQTACTAGNVELRPDKRTRPLVVRSVAGSCLTVNFTNLLAPVANPNNAQQDALFNDDQVAGRCAGFHASGTEAIRPMARQQPFVVPDWQSRAARVSTTCTRRTKAPSSSTATAPCSAASRAAAT
jgi:hypothetical protein